MGGSFSWWCSSDVLQYMGTVHKNMLYILVTRTPGCPNNNTVKKYE